LRWLPNRAGRRGGRFDPAGAILLGVGLAALTCGLTVGGEGRWTAPFVMAALSVAALALTAFTVVERSVKNPVLDLGLFRDRVFATANASLVLSFVAMFAVGFMLPFYLEELRRDSPLIAGLYLTPFPLALAVVAPVSGSLADKIGPRWLTFAGMAVCALALILIGMLDAQSRPIDIVWRLALAGVGQGLFQSPNNSALLGAAPAQRQGVASGILATGRVIGQCTSVALAGAIFGSTGAARAGRSLLVTPSIHDHDLLRHTFEHGFRITFWVCAGVAAGAALISLVRERRPRAVEADRARPAVATT
jgi:MFS family permease